MTMRRQTGTVNGKRIYWVALCGELALEGALEPS